MRLYKCEWPDGDVTLVLARSKEEALDELDELGEATEEMVTVVRSFMVTFTPKEVEHPEVDQGDFEWGLGHLGECMGLILPDVNEAVSRSGAFPLGGDDLEELDEDPTRCSGDCANCSEAPDYAKIGTGPMQALADEHLHRPSVLRVGDVFTVPPQFSPKLQKLFARNVEYMCFGLSQLSAQPPLRYLVGVVQLNEQGNGMCAIFSRQNLCNSHADDAVLLAQAERGLQPSDNYLPVILAGPGSKEAHIIDVPQVLRAFLAKQEVMASTTSPGSMENN